jgi:hypothetical protein
MEPIAARTAEGTSSKNWPGSRRCSRPEPAICGNGGGPSLRHLIKPIWRFFSVLGQLPDGFEDQWIDAVLRDRDAVRNFSQRVETERPPMELRYMKDVADDRGLDWEYTERVCTLAADLPRCRQRRTTASPLSTDFPSWRSPGAGLYRRARAKGITGFAQSARARAW